MIQFEPLSERLCKALIKDKYRKTTIINIYALIEDKYIEEKMRHYQELPQKFDIKIVPNGGLQCKNWVTA